MRTHRVLSSLQRQAYDAGMRDQTQMLAELRADNTALRSEAATLSGELSAQDDELAELCSTVRELVAGGSAADGHRAVAVPVSAAPCGAVAPACTLAPPPQPPLSVPAVNRTAAPPPPPATPTVPQGDGRACAHTCARAERARIYACPL